MRAQACSASLFGILARGRVDDGGPARRIAQEIASTSVRSGFEHLDDFDGEVVAAEAVDEAHGVVESELRDDVVLHGGRCGRGERDDGRGAQQGRCCPSMR